MTNTDFRQLFHPLLALHASDVVDADGFTIRTAEPVPVGARVDVLYGSQWTCGTVVSALRVSASHVHITLRAPCALDELEASCLTRSSTP